MKGFENSVGLVCGGYGWAGWTGEFDEDGFGDAFEEGGAGEGAGVEEGHGLWVDGGCVVCMISWGRMRFFNGEGVVDGRFERC